MPSKENWSARRINKLHDQLPQLHRYLEVGLASGRTFEDVKVPQRVGVDPRPQFDLENLPTETRVDVVTSDEFFAACNCSFDIAFLDGLHTYRQTYYDLINVLTSSPSAVVLVDDVVPWDEVSAMADRSESLAERKRRGLSGAPWHGDVFRMVPCLVEHHPELAIRTIVGDDNAQLLTWKPDPSYPIRAVAVEVLNEYEVMEFSQLFSDGVPASFSPVSESEAIQAAVSAVRCR